MQKGYSPTMGWIGFALMAIGVLVMLPFIHEKGAADIAPLAAIFFWPGLIVWAIYRRRRNQWNRWVAQGRAMEIGRDSARTMR
jgi:uncharacterized protein with PQ loop repeat